MSLNYVTLILDLYDGQGNAEVRGAASFVPSAVLTDAGVEIIGQDPIPAVFSAGGLPHVKLLATDSSGPAPSGWTWGVTFSGQGAAPSGFSFFLPANPMTFTATNASPCVFTSSGTAYVNGTGVQLSGGSLPAGFSAGTTYFVVAASGSTFELAATAGGSALGSTGSGSGSVVAVSQFLSNLIPVSSGTSFQAYMPLPSGTPSAGNVPVATGSGEASAWGDVGTVSVLTNSSASGTVNLDASAYGAFNITETGNVTFTFSGATAGELASFTLYLFQNVTGGWTTTWPGSVTWVGGTAPTLNTAASALNLLVFETVNGGTTWYGSLVTAAPSLPLTVANGGTGGSSLGAYGLLAGGASSTSPVQSISGAGTSGQVLTSSGASALPAWETLPAMHSTLVAPSGATAETFPRVVAQGATTAVVTQDVHCAAIGLPAGLPVNNITLIVDATAATSVTHGFYALLDSGLVVRAISADQTGGNWTSPNTAVTLSVSGSAYTTTYSGLYYIAVCMTTSGTLPTFVGLASSLRTGAYSTAPVYAGVSSSTETTPPSTGATLGGLTGGGGRVFYAYTS